jgi:hypothetical protein
MGISSERVQLISCPCKRQQMDDAMQVDAAMVGTGPIPQNRAAEEFEYAQGKPLHLRLLLSLMRRPD